MREHDQRIQHASTNRQPWSRPLLPRLLILLVLVGTPSLHAQRPTEGGLFPYAVTDTLTFFEPTDDRVRVHYSSDGPNAVSPSDTNQNGTPDFVEVVAEVALETLDLYENQLGLTRPLNEEGFAVVNDGGSNALDFYLVDFGGSSDGFFGTDACDENLQCTGHMVVENDFQGYGYSSIREGIETVVPHELFHAVQAAYNGSLPIWFTEGTAVWAELVFDPNSRDFIYFANAYLEDTGRSLTKPPAGPVPAFAYGTGIFWNFLSLRHSPAIIEEILTGTIGVTEDNATIESVISTLESHNDSLQAAWAAFTIFNLATGQRAGIIESYANASSLAGIRAEAQGRVIDDEERFYPLSATYYRIDHPGGPLYQSTDEIADNLVFTLHPVVQGEADGPVEEAVNTWDAREMGPQLVHASLPSGGYWLTVTNTAYTGSSSKLRLCAGTESLALSCLPTVDDDEISEPDTTSESGGCQQTHSGMLTLLILGLWSLCRRKAQRAIAV